MNAVASLPPMIDQVRGVAETGTSASSAVIVVAAVVPSSSDSQASARPPPLVITGALSFTPPTAIVNARVVNEPSVLTARTTMFRASTASRSIAPATRTTPLSASMLKRPPAESSST